MFRGGPMAGLGMPSAKPKNFRRTLMRLLGYFRPQRLALLVIISAAVIGTAFNVFGPKILGMATTKLFEGILAKFQHKPGASVDFAYIHRILLILIGMYVVSAAFQYLQQYLMAGVAQKTVYALRREVDEKLERLPLSYFDSRTHGEILSLVANDLDNVSSTLQQNVTQAITSVVTLVGVIVMMLTISPLLTLVVGLTLPLSIAVTTVIAKRAQRYFLNQQNALGALNGHVEEMYTGHQIVKAFGHEDTAVAQFGELNDRYYEAGWRAQFVSGIIMPLMRSIGNLGYLLVASHRRNPGHARIDRHR